MSTRANIVVTDADGAELWCNHAHNASRGWYYTFLTERNNPNSGIPQEQQQVCGFPGCVNGHIDPE